ncbi:MAG: DUF3606 domain-containing protein [Chitinophagaceae bacterium]
MKENSKKINLDTIKINLNQDHEVQFWSRRWGISTLQLEKAIKNAGSNTSKLVEDYLKANGKLLYQHGTRID